jgi:hypothetical protein
MADSGTKRLSNINWKLTAAVAGVLIFGSGTLPQGIEHAPTVAQCQADQVSWGKQIADALQSGATPFAKYSFVVLQKMANEMGDCEAVDPSKRPDYSESQAIIQDYMALRQANFLSRHKLIQQFLDEDRAGNR